LLSKASAVYIGRRTRSFLAELKTLIALLKDIPQAETIKLNNISIKGYIRINMFVHLVTIGFLGGVKSFALARTLGQKLLGSCQ
jgi:hypothetical protein